MLRTEIVIDKPKTILILGAIESFCDLIEDIKEMGIKTISCDYYPDAPGKKIADYAYNTSTTDIDALIELGKKHDIDGIICAFSDRNLYSCYKVAKELSLPTFYTPELIDILTDKIKLKDHLKKNGFPILNYTVVQEDFVESDLDGFTFPVIIKPIDNSGSKGIYVCNSIEEIREKSQLCLTEGVQNKTDFIVEEFYPKNEICITAWVKNKISYVTCIYDVGKNYGDEIVTNSIVFPSKYTRTDLNGISDLVQRLIDSLHIKEGPVTVQCLIGEKGLKVNEVMYRLAGGSPYMFTEYLGGPNLAKMLAQFSLAEDIDYKNLETFTPNVGKTVYQFRIYATKPGKIIYDFNEDSIKKQIPECTYFHIYFPSESSFSTVPTDGRVVARLFCEVDNSFEKSYESFIDRLEQCAVIYNDKGENITTYNRPDSRISYSNYDLRL